MVVSSFEDGFNRKKSWQINVEINNLPPISSSALKIAAKTSASKLLEEVKVTCRVFLDNKGGFFGYLKDLHLLSSSESLLSGGAFCTSAKLTGLSESVIIFEFYLLFYIFVYLMLGFSISNISNKKEFIVYKLFFCKK